jgi:hypothetical protein
MPLLSIGMFVMLKLIKVGLGTGARPLTGDEKLYLRLL